MSIFSIKLQEFQATCSRNAAAIAQRTAFDAFSSVVMMTPVDTGRARANWIPSIGEPAIGVTDAFDPAGSNTIDQIMSFLPEFKLGTIAYLTNNLPYILTIEDGGYPNPPKARTGKTENGYSIQAPAGMVQLTVLDITNKFESIARGAKP
jgi:hypothetical protein